MILSSVMVFIKYELNKMKCSIVTSNITIMNVKVLPGGTGKAKRIITIAGFVRTALKSPGIYEMTIDLGLKSPGKQTHILLSS
jgi:hypothetical protein